ncbi:MAG TPA: NAD(P)-dependent oxidoreductase [Polyangiaceae bacterium]|jgi:uronate dehydrogenase
MTKVLVTGSAGAIGVPVCRELSRRGHDVRGFDRVHTPDVRRTIVGQLEDADAVRDAVDGVDAVVHLAAHPFDAPFPELVGPNVLGLFHVLDAARGAGVSRVVLASSIQVVGRRKGRPGPASTRTAAPGNHYALTKLWAEQMGRMYSRKFDLSVIAARVTWMVRNAEEARRMLMLERQDIYVSRGDVARFFAQAVEATDIRFAVLYAVGPDGAERVDLESSRRLIGYEPADAWPAGLGFELSEITD